MRTNDGGECAISNCMMYISYQSVDSMLCTFMICRFTLPRLTHSKLRSITPVTTKVHMILQKFVVLTWMRDTIEFV